MVKYAFLVCAAVCVLAGCEGVAALFHGEKPRAKYTVTFDANGASGTVPSQSASAGDAITLPSGAGLTLSDKAFKGWNTNTIGTGAKFESGARYVVYAHTTLYAQWEGNGSPANGSFAGTAWKDEGGVNSITFGGWSARISGMFWAAYDGRTLESEYRSGSNDIALWITKSESRGFLLLVTGGTLTYRNTTSGVDRVFYKVDTP